MVVDNLDMFVDYLIALPVTCIITIPNPSLSVVINDDDNGSTCGLSYVDYLTTSGIISVMQEVL